MNSSNVYKKYIYHLNVTNSLFEILVLDETRLAARVPMLNLQATAICSLELLRFSY